MRPEQLPIFDDGIPPKKSHHAKQLNPEAKRNTQIKEQLRRSGNNGCTAYELAAQLHLSSSQVSGALSELHDWGEVQKTEAMRRTPSGDQATVWVVAKGR
jgi:predicted transcriptional regulator